MTEGEQYDTLIRSENCVDGYQYHHEDVPVSWERCDLRHWLNSDFYQMAFSPSEKLIIADTTFDYDGKEVVDKVFLPSLDEARSEHSSKPYRAKGTDYLAMMDITKKWTGRRQDWSVIYAQLVIFFGDRISE